MAELLLPEDADNNSYSHLRNTVSTTSSCIINNTYNNFSDNNNITKAQLEAPTFYNNENNKDIFKEIKKPKIGVKNGSSVISTTNNKINQVPQLLIAPTPIYPPQQISTTSNSPTTIVPIPINVNQNFELQFPMK